MSVSERVSMLIIRTIIVVSPQSIESIRQDSTGRTQQAGLNRQDSTGRTQQAGLNREDSTGRTQQGGLNRQDSTGRTQQGGLNRQDSTGRTQQGGLKTLMFVTFHRCSSSVYAVVGRIVYDLQVAHVALFATRLVS
eukprot:Blabericola_migrator_1__7239@NODE_3678_length_1582_cov_10_109571_g2282_i0_p1_GENE_NODE_3678_length_1582_cov_10_109571_g2282_i0NODE_3678_length_1582_cov_10_109571_g2282_i0_p1_ORF_typecomplete_len136_score7_96LepA_C/PF06421_12/1LepA_C/PF06421_12/2_1e02LepA_C/PF06421_12/9_2e02_NODE_3678_length_1582_cov_10_109571_g2282_i07681175